ncbi:MarR family winged helix-turn-helix transcriptional regulator [Thalassobacillus sp. C254]|uniref:MarR family winged helix-turn-helix transcriptional regulator n=1 Tax=Thalassobacillus sp. C254 TaxID=1225341 RepID=UPI0022B6D9E7|nr:MarR family winged helix-turn-helix transcriptional regulator [Thalassobacillus sp. C254]
MTQTELRDYLAVEAPPLTRNVQRLVKKEIVKQVPGNDKRSKTIELTAYAKREYPEWEKAVVQANEQMLAHIPKRSRDSLEHTLKEWIASISLPKE